MITNIKFSIRSLLRQKGYTLVNIIGLALGMSLFLLIAVYVYMEFQTDKFHKNYHQIYRIEIEHAVTASMVANFTRTVLPEALEICRMDVGSRNILARVDEKQLRINELIYADSSFFNIFSFDLIHGDPATALRNPFSIVISQSEAKKLFGEEHPIGKTVEINNYQNFEVSGVMKDAPGNSSITATAVIPFTALVKMRGDSTILNDWNNWNYFTFVLLPQNHDISVINPKFQAGMDKIANETLGFNNVELGMFLRPFSELYFNQNIRYDNLNKGNKTFITIYSVIAIFILIIAVVNFINLSTAMAFRRAKEVGLKKVIGATRNSLIRQYLAEAILLSLVALLIAILLFEILLPEFNRLTQANLNFTLLNQPQTILAFIAFALAVGILSGLYPAVYLTKFEPAEVIKGGVTKGKGGSLLRKTLIVFQFTVSIGIIFSTLVIYSQMKFIRSKDMGFNKSNVVFFWGSGEIPRNYAAFKNDLKQIPGVEFVSASNSIPGYVGMNWGRMVDTTERRIDALPVDHEFFEVYELEIVEGRRFEESIITDMNNTFVLNETAVKLFGLENPVGVRFANGTVIGVVKDFSYISLHHPVGPLVLAYMPGWCGYVNVRISGHNTPETIGRMGEVWNRYAPDFPFNYRFLDDSIDRLYNKEKRLFELFMFFSGLAIFVACLGLSGLALFSTQQRTREVGVRKVFGSSVNGIVILLTGDFLRWVLLANIIAWPIAWFLMNRWLQNFAFRISIQWWMFVVAAALALLIALVTISWQALRAAMANPVEALKYE